MLRSPNSGYAPPLFEDAGLTELAVARPCFLDLRQVDSDVNAGRKAANTVTRVLSAIKTSVSSRIADMMTTRTSLQPRICGWCDTHSASFFSRARRSRAMDST